MMRNKKNDEGTRIAMANEKNGNHVVEGSEILILQNEEEMCG